MHGQDREKIDSLWNEYKKAKHDTTRIKLYLKIGDLYEYQIPDTALLYYHKALMLAETNNQQSSDALGFGRRRSTIKNQKFLSLEADALRYIGIVHYDHGRYDNAIEYYLKSLKITEELQDKKRMSDCYNSIGLVHKDQGSYDKAIEYSLKALKIDEELQNKKGMSKCYTNIGIVHYYQGSYDKAIEYFLKSLKIAEELQNKKGMPNCYTNIGNVHYYQGRYDKAIEYFLKSLKINEELQDKKGMSACYTNIGIVHKEQGSYDKAIDYYLKSLRIKEELQDKKGMSNCYNNIGIVHADQGSYDKAIEYYLKSLKIDKELQDKKGMSLCYNNIGRVHADLGRYNKAIDFYLKSLIITEELQDKNGMALVYGNLAELNIKQADSLSHQGERKREVRLKSALKYGQKAMEIAKEIKSAALIYQVAGVLQHSYKSLGNYKKALEYAEVFIQTKDTIFSEEKTKALTQMQAQYEAEKRELTIQKLEKEKLLQNETIARKNAESKKQRILIFSFLAGFIIILVFSVFLYRLFLQKKKANVIIARKNQSLEIAFAEISTQKEEITSQRDEIEAQRDKLSEQNHLLAEQKKEITDSINYAKRIQTAVLPTGEYANSILGEHFILFKPKDIVSGDFYWGTRINEWLIVTVADCTGHGVPGAFMSMLGVSFLNEIVRKKEITNASEALDHLRESIIEALQQKGASRASAPEGSGMKDGMDLALVVINTTTSTDAIHGVFYNMQFAGANNPLYIVKKGSSLQEAKPLEGIKGDLSVETRLIEVKADKQPVGIHSKMTPFTNHEILLNKGDTLYLTSDGYEDQFGGEKYKKFMSKRLKELFVSISDKPMNEQRDILDTTFENWKGSHEQIDDVTVMGLKIQ